MFQLKTQVTETSKPHLINVNWMSDEVAGMTSVNLDQLAVNEPKAVAEVIAINEVLKKHHKIGEPLALTISQSVVKKTVRKKLHTPLTKFCKFIQNDYQLCRLSVNSNMYFDKEATEFSQLSLSNDNKAEFINTVIDHKDIGSLTISNHAIDRFQTRALHSFEHMSPLTALIESLCDPSHLERIDLPEHIIRKKALSDPHARAREVELWYNSKHEMEFYILHADKPLLVTVYHRPRSAHRRSLAIYSTQ